MSRLSRAKKREQKSAEGSPSPMTAPIDVRVRAVVPGQGAGSGVYGEGVRGEGARGEGVRGEGAPDNGSYGDGAHAAAASIGGVPVVAVPGEEIQHTVLTHLQRIAVATGHPVLATVHDERIGYVVPLRVDADGSSTLTADPVRAAPPVERQPAWDTPTHVLRPLPDPEPDPSPTHRLRTLPGPEGDVPPGTVQPPRGEFGPPPVMDTGPDGTDVPRTDHTANTPAQGLPDATRQQFPDAAPQRLPDFFPQRFPDSIPDPDPDPAPDPDPDPKPAPPRGFDAVAEAILGDAPPPDPTADASPFAEPTARIGEAVKTGRIDAAAELAERTLTQADDMLGPDHPEVLRLRELAAYAAYLAGDPGRAFALSLDAARAHHRTQDADAAYGDVQSAFTAWRAVRDPEQGLELGRDLIALWTELTAEDGPAADDIEQLESARARMDRLAARAAKSAEPPVS